MAKTSRKKKAAKTKVKKRSSKLLGKAPTDHHFRLGGDSLGSMFELVDALEQMTDDEFGHFVNEHKNDFATWIHDIFDDKLLADDVRQAFHRLDTQRVILKKLVKEALRIKN